MEKTTHTLPLGKLINQASHWNEENPEGFCDRGQVCEGYDVILKTIGRITRILNDINTTANEHTKLDQTFKMFDLLFQELPNNLSTSGSGNDIIQFYMPFSPEKRTDLRREFTSADKMASWLLSRYWEGASQDNAVHLSELKEDDNINGLMPIKIDNDIIGYLRVPERLGSIFEVLLQQLNLMMTLSYKNIHIAELGRLAHMDELTGIKNRRNIDRNWPDIAGRAQQFSVAMLDIDNFKKVNDTYGHESGDQILSFLGSCMRDFFGKDNGEGDIVFGRYGGEEFLVLFPEMDEQSAYRVLVQFQEFVTRKYNDEGWRDTPHPEKLTMSIGVAGYHRNGMDTFLRPLAERNLKSAIDSADRAMYVAKKAGKDRVETASGVTPKNEATEPLQGDDHTERKEKERGFNGFVRRIRKLFGSSMKK